MAVIIYKSGNAVESLTVYISQAVANDLRKYGISRSRVAQAAFEREVERVKNEKGKRPADAGHSSQGGAIFESGTTPAE